jgi:hypothetical protein
MPNYKTKIETENIPVIPTLNKRKELPADLSTLVDLPYAAVRSRGRGVDMLEYETSAPSIWGQNGDLALKANKYRIFRAYMSV